ncbi:MAG: patatin-like phospholipase family protein [Thermodesulfovibrionales bacterium]
MVGVRVFILLVSVIMGLSACAPTKEAVQPVQKPAKIAVVLGAGAARGFSHIGVLKVLEANAVPVHMVVGTSAGSLVGSLYAYGYTPYQIQKTAMALEKGDIADLAIPDNGFIKGELLEAFVNKSVRNIPLEKLKVPFFAVATNIQTGQEVVFGKGNTGAAVRASCSIPGVFRPMKVGGQMYVDGGVVSPVAVEAARRQGADIVIAVDISSDLDPGQPESTLETILQAVNIMYAKISHQQLTRADVVIRPRVGHIGSGDFLRRHEAILEGEKAAAEAMPRIKEIITRLKGEGRG